MRAARAGETALLRRPDAVRPWQHVLDPLHGYFLYAQALAEGADVPRTLNFGPTEPASVTVREIAEALTQALGAPGWRHEKAAGIAEKGMLSLDAGRAVSALGWRPKFDTKAALAATVAWYRAWANGANAAATTDRQIQNFEEAA